MKMRKKGAALLAALLLLTMAFGLSACGQDEELPPEEIEYAGIIAAYANEKYIETGDENVPALIANTNGQSILAEEGRQYFVLLDGLLREPEGASPTLENADTMINDKIQFEDVRFEELKAEGSDETTGTVYVDFKAEDLEGESGEMLQLPGGGSLAETLLISQIVESLVHSFEEVDQVQFLINGEKPETLMGHCDVTEPYTEGIYTLQVE